MWILSKWFFILFFLLHITTGFSQESIQQVHQSFETFIEESETKIQEISSDILAKKESNIDSEFFFQTEEIQILTQNLNSLNFFLTDIEYKYFNFYQEDSKLSQDILQTRLDFYEDLKILSTDKSLDNKQQALLNILNNFLKRLSFFQDLSQQIQSSFSSTRSFSFSDKKKLASYLDKDHLYVSQIFTIITEEIKILDLLYQYDFLLKTSKNH